MPSRSIVLDGPLDLARTLFPLRRGTGDPTWRVEGVVAWRGVRTPEGPAAVRIERTAPDRVVAEAVGRGAGWALERAPGVVGALDDASGFRPRHPAVEDAWRRHRGVRLTRTAEILPALVAAICEQKVTGARARTAWRGLVRATSEPAPGGWDVWLPPDPERLATLPSWAFHRAELERRRADVVRHVASRAAAIEALAERPLEEARTALLRIPGVGPWTVAEVARLALGDADAVSVGDYHVPNLVAWSLAGEAAGRRRPDARAAGAVPGPPRPGPAAARGERGRGAQVGPAGPRRDDRRPVRRGAGDGRRTPG